MAQWQWWGSDGLLCPTEIAVVIGARGISTTSYGSEVIDVEPIPAVRPIDWLWRSRLLNLRRHRAVLALSALARDQASGTVTWHGMTGTNTTNTTSRHHVDLCSHYTTRMREILVIVIVYIRLELVPPQSVIPGNQNTEPGNRRLSKISCNILFPWAFLRHFRLPL